MEFPVNFQKLMEKIRFKRFWSLMGLVLVGLIIIFLGILDSIRLRFEGREYL